MKKGTIVLLSTLFFCCFLINAQAQRGGGKVDPEKRLERQTQALVEKLGLSEEQAGQIKTINKEFHDKMQATRSESQDMDEMRTQMKTLREEQKTAYQEILTAEQFTAWEKFMEEQREQRGHRGKRAPRGE